MQVVNCSRGDLSLMFHSGVKTNGSNILRSSGSDQYYDQGVFSNYVAGLNQYYQSDEYLHKAQELINFRSRTSLDIMIYLLNKDDISIGKLMQEYMMANPYIAKAYDTGLIKGFDNGLQHDYCHAYTDRQRYLQSVDGILQEDPNHDECLVVRSLADEHSLSIDQQDNIFQSWEFLCNQIRSGIDPTDI